MDSILTTGEKETFMRTRGRLASAQFELSLLSRDCLVSELYLLNHLEHLVSILEDARDEMREVKRKRLAMRTERGDRVKPVAPLRKPVARENQERIDRIMHLSKVVGQ